MSYILESIDVKLMLPFFTAVAIEASHSPCQKSQRGAGIYLPSTQEIIALNHNRPKNNYSCIVPICKSQCGEYCDHAEANVLLDVKNRGIDISGSWMLHLKIKDGLPAYSDNPSCLKCSTLVADSSLEALILYTSSGLKSFRAGEFHEETQRHLGVSNIK